MSNGINKIVEFALSLPKGDWKSYAQCKRLICELSLSQIEYEHATDLLCRILEV